MIQINIKSLIENGWVNNDFNAMKWTKGDYTLEYTEIDEDYWFTGPDIPKGGTVVNDFNDVIKYI